MSRLSWDNAGERLFEIGVSKVVLFVKANEPIEYRLPKNQGTAVTNYASGVAWSGVIDINEKPEGGEPTDVWTEDYKYDTLRSPEVMTGTIEAYMYPNEFSLCDGSYQYRSGIWIGQQPRQSFAICYRTENGNDTDGLFGYKIHVIYDMSVSPSEREYETYNDSPEATKLSWDFTTVPVPIQLMDIGQRYISTIVFDSAYLDSETMEKLEDCLYGTATTSPTLPDPIYLLNFVSGSGYNPNMVVDTYNATAEASDILGGKTAFVKGNVVTGTIPTLSAQTYTPGQYTQTISSGQYLEGSQTINGDLNLIEENIRAGVTIFDVTGVYEGSEEGISTSDATATSEDILDGATAYVNGRKITGEISRKSAFTYIPGTSRQYIWEGQYLEGNQTIEGDSNLLPENIRPGVSIFGVSGNMEALQSQTYIPTTTDQVIQEGYYLAGNQTIAGDANLVGTNIRPGTSIFGVVGAIPALSATSYTPRSTSQTLTAGYYLEGNQTILGDENLIGTNIRPGTSIFGVVGAIPALSTRTYTPTTTNQTLSAGYYLEGNQTIAGDPNLIPINIRTGVEIFGVTGSMETCSTYWIVPRAASQTISGSCYLEQNLVVAGDSSLIGNNIRYGEEIFGVNGTFTNDATATSGDILYGKVAYVRGQRVEGYLSGSSGSTYIPGVADLYIPSGLYSGQNVVKGDPNLIGANIKQGVSIFGVVGTLTTGGGATGDFEGLLTRSVTTVSNSMIASLGPYAFAGCRSLRTISLDNCSVIDSTAFWRTTSSIETLYLPNYSGSIVFESRTMIDYLTIGTESLGTIGSMNCVPERAWLPNVSIWDQSYSMFGSARYVEAISCHTIGSYAFESCSYLSAVSFPMCGYIYDAAFSGCTSLIQASFPTCGIISADAFSGCESLMTAIFPSCTDIGDYAFYNCSSLSQISFPICSYLGDYAFKNCNTLELASFPLCLEIGSETFAYCSGLQTAYFQSCSAIYESAFCDCSSLTSISFPVCETIGSSAFYSCATLTEAVFPSCSVVEQGAFTGCMSISTISFPLCESLGAEAFMDCYTLRSLYLPVCSEIPYSAFANCQELAYASLPVCEYIYEGAFENCANLISVYLPFGSVVGLDSSAFIGTPIDSPTYSGVYGSVYVPASLITDYREDYVWMNFADRIVGM